jgi:hypothetical protein
VTADRDASGFAPKPDKLGIGPRAGRKPLGADMKRLEQIRLASAVGADNENELGREFELESGVRADVA